MGNRTWQLRGLSPRRGGGAGVDRWVLVLKGAMPDVHRLQSYDTLTLCPNTRAGQPLLSGTRMSPYMAMFQRDLSKCLWPGPKPVSVSRKSELWLDLLLPCRLQEHPRRGWRSGQKTFQSLGSRTQVAPHPTNIWRRKSRWYPLLCRSDPDAQHSGSAVREDSDGQGRMARGTEGQGRAGDGRVKTPAMSFPTLLASGFPPQLPKALICPRPPPLHIRDKSHFVAD